MKRIIISIALALAAMVVIDTPTAAQVNVVPAIGNRDSAGSAYANTEGQKTSYFAGLGSNTPAATPTDIAILTGSATKTIKVTKVRITVQATAAGVVEFKLLKRTAGTQSAVNTPFLDGTHSGPFDSLSVASTVTAAGLAGVYTSNPASSGTLLGIVDDWTVALAANTGLVLEYTCREPSQCITLRGVTQVLAINGASHTLLTGEKVGVQFAWTEE